MLLNSSLSPVLLVSAYLLTQSWAYGPLPRRAEGLERRGEAIYPYADPGDDKSAVFVTTGHFTNHLCINVRNATESINWYNKAFGLRLMFTLHVSEHFSISYMGHSPGGRNGTGYQTNDGDERPQEQHRGTY
jgi:lactoylglutathione lyase